jgi:hypothetical protein
MKYHSTHGLCSVGPRDALVNSTLHACLDVMLWKEAAQNDVAAPRVFTHLIKTNNAAGLRFFMELRANPEVHLPAFDMTHHRSEPDTDHLEPEARPLLVVADLDNVPLARVLLEKGAEVQYFDGPYGKFSPIHVARSAEMVQLLLDHKADPNFKDDTYRWPLDWYAIRENIAAMRVILRHGAQVNPKTNYDTVLHEAAIRNLDMVKLLVNHGAHVQARGCVQITVLQSAAKAGKLDVVKFLVEQWPEGVRVRDEESATTLHFAAASGNVDVLKFLMEQWPEGMMERDAAMRTPLHHAIFFPFAGRRTEMVRFLLDGWPEMIREKHGVGNTHLHFLCNMDTWAMTEEQIKAMIEVVRLLVERWTEGKTALNDEGKTPLQVLVQRVSWQYELRDEVKEELIALVSSP